MSHTIPSRRSKRNGADARKTAESIPRTVRRWLGVFSSMLGLPLWLWVAMGFHAVSPHAGAAERRVRDGERSRLLDFIPPVVATYQPSGSVSGAEVKALLRPQIEQMVKAGRPPAREELENWAKRLTDSILRHRLLVEEAAAAGYVPDRRAGLARIAEMKRQLGRANYVKTLEVQGITEDELAERLAELGAIDRWIEDEIAPPRDPTPEQAKAYYDGHPDEFREPELLRASHILVRVDPESSTGEKRKAKKKADGFLREIREQGTPFAELAARGSDCPSAARGGDLGAFPPGRMVAAFETVVRSLGPGQISQVVETEFGFHIIKGGRRIPARILPFAEVEERIRTAGQRQAVDKMVDELTARLLRERRAKVLLGDE